MYESPLLFVVFGKQHEATSGSTLIRGDGKFFLSESEVFISIQNLMEVSHVNAYTVCLYLYTLALAI